MKKKLGIDFGGDRLKIYKQNEGIVFDEPSIIAVKKTEKKYQIIAFGESAENKEILNNKNTFVFHPTFNKDIENIEYASKLLEYALTKISKSKNYKCYIATPSGIPETIKHKYSLLCTNAKIQKFELVDSSYLSILGSNIHNVENEILTIDLGDSKCNFAILKNLQLYESAVLGIGGNSISSAIISLLEEKNFNISEETANTIKKDLSSLLDNNTKKIQICGINTTTQVAHEKVISSQEIYPIIKGIFEEVVLIAKSLIQSYFQKTKSIPKLIILSGGLSNISGIEKFFIDKFPKQKIFICENAENVISLGFSKIFN